MHRTRTLDSRDSQLFGSRGHREWIINAIALLLRSRILTHNLPLGFMFKFWRGHVADLTVYLRAGNVSVGGFRVPEGASKVQVERLGLFSFYGIKRCTGLELWTHVIVSYSAVGVIGNE